MTLTHHLDRDLATAALREYDKHVAIFRGAKFCRRFGLRELARKELHRSRAALVRAEALLYAAEVEA